MSKTEHTKEHVTRWICPVCAQIEEFAYPVEDTIPACRALHGATPVNMLQLMPEGLAGVNPEGVRDLLTACRALVDVKMVAGSFGDVDRIEEAKQKGRAAIAKATEVSP